MPLTLCNASPDATLWVVEMGMNQTGEIARLSELTQPTVALVVNVQPVHLEKLGSLEAIRREKVSIAQGLPRDGVLVLPTDVEAPEWNGKIVRFGGASEVRELKHAAHGESWDVTAEVGGKQIAFGLTPGAPHRLQNALAALASIHAAGLDAAALAKELGEVGIMTGRGVEQTAGGVTVIDDSFNGNPASMVAALDSLKARPVKPAGASPFSATCWNSAPTRRPITRSWPSDLPGIDGVYCVGPLMRHLYDLLPAKQRPRLARRPGHAGAAEGRRLAAKRRRRGGQGQQKDVLGQQVCAEAAGRLAGKGVNWPKLTTRAFRAAIRSPAAAIVTKICLV